MDLHGGHRIGKRGCNRSYERCWRAIRRAAPPAKARAVAMMSSQLTELFPALWFGPAGGSAGGDAGCDSSFGVLTMTVKGVAGELSVIASSAAEAGVGGAAVAWGMGVGTGRRILSSSPGRISASDDSSFNSKS